MGTIHANSARDAVMKLQTLPLLAGSNISHAFIVPTFASAIDFVVQIAMDIEGRRRVTEVIALTGRTEKSQIEMETLWKWTNGEYVEGLALAAIKSRFTQTSPVESRIP
jgi:pilus assembly protein CpaF